MHITKVNLVPFFSFCFRLILPKVYKAPQGAYFVQVNLEVSGAGWGNRYGADSIKE